MSSVRKSFVWSFVQKYFGLCISLITLPILSRILTPQEIGIYTVGVAFVTLAHMIRDFGVADYIVQEKDLTETRIKTAFSVSFLIGWTIGLLLIALSTPISWLYDEPGVRNVMRVLGLNFFIIPFSLPVLALLRRRMAFNVRARMLMVSRLTHAVTSISLVVAGFGYMSLAWASLVGVTTTAVLSARYRPAGIGLIPKFTEWRRVASFGGIATVALMLNVIGERAADLVLGRLIGFNAVGIYSRGESLVNLFREGALDAIMPVILPAFSEQHRAGDDIKPSYLTGIGYLTGVAWPFFGFVALMAYPIIRILFGPQWDAAVPVAQVLCFAAAISMPWEFANQLLIAIGHVRREMYAQMVAAPPQILALVILSAYGVEAAAMAVVVRFVLLAAVRTWNLKRLLDIAFLDILGALLRSFGVLVLSCIAPVAVLATMQIDPAHLWAPLLIAAAGSGVGWLSGLVLFNHPLKAEILLHAGNLRVLLGRAGGGG